MGVVLSGAAPFFLYGLATGDWRPHHGHHAVVWHGLLVSERVACTRRRGGPPMDRPSFFVRVLLSTLGERHPTLMFSNCLIMSLAEAASGVFGASATTFSRWLFASALLPSATEIRAR